MDGEQIRCQHKAKLFFYEALPTVSWPDDVGPTDVVTKLFNDLDLEPLQMYNPEFSQKLIASLWPRHGRGQVSDLRT